MSILYEALQESIILARFFATIPFEELPEPNKQFVMNIAHSADISELIREQTMVLSLLGTRGVKSERNDRNGSPGHEGIP